MPAAQVLLDHDRVRHAARRPRPDTEPIALEAGGERGAKCSERWLGTPAGEVEAGLTRPLRHRLILEREPRDEAETGASNGRAPPQPGAPAVAAAQPVAA